MTYVILYTFPPTERQRDSSANTQTDFFFGLLRKAYKYDICHSKLNNDRDLRGFFMEIKPNKTLDCLGLYCPEPVFRTRTELDDMKVGEVLEVLADDPAAEEDIKSLVKHLGQKITDISKKGNSVRILIKKVK
jgi:TusA-related sulfurtransferase